MTEQPAGQRLFLVRAGLGLAQGLLLYLLYHAQDARLWPATHGLVFAPLLLVCGFIPLLLNQALGEMPWRRAGLWALTAAAVIALLAIYDIWAAWPVDWQFQRNASPLPIPHIFPAPRLIIFCGAGLFIAHALVVGAWIDRRFQASYSTHFDVAWKLAVQLALSAAFVLAFWLLLWLGANLFSLIKLTFFRELLGHEWFTIPVIALATAGALHLTDIRPALVRGVRTLGLTLLSWLLPLITLIVAGFLVSLPFTGLAPLWAVGHASALLLVAAAVCIILINAAHQDGDAERLPPGLLRWSGTVAAVLPLPLGTIAIYALYLRVHQYGWTEERVLVAAALLVAGVEALGYARAAVARGAWLQRIESWNFYVALLVLAVMAALSTPLADPARIAVADQMARLESGKVKPEAFDFNYLRWQGGRYGMAALTELTQSKIAAIRQAAAATLKQTASYKLQPAPPSTLAERVTVYPAGQKLPPDFADSVGKNSDVVISMCLQFQSSHCDMILGDFDGDGRQDVMLVEGSDVTLFRRDAGGVWRSEGEFYLPSNCPNVLAKLRSGDYRLAPDPHPWNRIEVGGLQFKSQTPSRSAPACPK